MSKNILGNENLLHFLTFVVTWLNTKCYETHFYFFFPTILRWHSSFRYLI
ncbi:hypothetical protein HanRHA438_Chr11g0506041 [Helianthus annuus]|nr:hypothetical protein HanRHA438_Chr11g0506041 [Helianthus annuus]